MRQFGITALQTRLLAAGFREVCFMSEDRPEVGVYFDADSSQPLIARKQPFEMGRAARRQLLELWRATDSEARRLATQARLAAKSRWVRLGRKLGVGPRLV